MTESKARFWNTLSGRFLVLTIVFVMLAQILIFVPSVARFRSDFLMLRLEKAQIAALAQLAVEDMIRPELEAELLANAGVYNVVLRRDAVRELVLSSPVPDEITATYDLRIDSPMSLISDALGELLDPTNRILRVMGTPTQSAGDLIEVTMQSRPLRNAMLDYGLRVLALSAMISVFSALLLFLAVQRLLVMPITRVVDHMRSYSEAPEDARRVIQPTAEVRELRVAEEALESLQLQLTAALRQKERLAQLGGAVAKISHDLRNILTTAQLFADRLEGSADPGVARSAPKVVASISRAVSLCEATLTFGKAEEPAPRMTRFGLRRLIEDVAEGEALAEEGKIAFVIDVPAGMNLRADPEQLYRVLGNLIRNARQAIEATGAEGTIEVAAGEDDHDWWISVGDTGPGLPQKAREHLFEAFQGGARKGGTGLGLSIAAELVRGHGGRLELMRSDREGTEFQIRLPKQVDVSSAA